MSDRAPDNQPTENLQLMLTNEEARLKDWKRSRDAHHEAVIRQTEIIVRQQDAVNRLRWQLGRRLEEEAEAKEQELTGL